MRDSAEMLGVERHRETSEGMFHVEHLAGTAVCK